MTDRRDVYTPKHPSPVAGTPVFVEEEATGVVRGEALKAIRRKRSTEDRVERLEDKHDELAEVVTETRVLVGTMTGKLDAFIDTVQAERDRAKLEHQTEQIRIGSRAKVIVAIVGAIGAALGVIITAMAGCA